MSDQVISATEETAMPQGKTHTQPPLDDMMLVMDVVDTLRRRERLVKRELDDLGREEDLIQRLQKIYAQQGIAVPDHVIEQGVAALKEDRFTYKPAKNSLATKLAHLYITRGRWGKWLAGGVALIVIGLIANYFVFVAPTAALPKELVLSHAAALALAKSDNARTTAKKILNTGTIALGNEDTDGAKRAITLLDDLRVQLEQEYTIQILNRQGLRSGVWRIPDVNTQARNYYIIVEAIDSTGSTLSVPIKSEESGKTDRVKTWGLRVEKGIFTAVANDKQDNGIIENNRFGYKERGYLVPNYAMRTTGGAITQW